MSNHSDDAVIVSLGPGSFHHTFKILLKMLIINRNIESNQ